MVKPYCGKAACFRLIENSTHILAYVRFGVHSQCLWDSAYPSFRGVVFAQTRTMYTHTGLGL